MHNKKFIAILAFAIFTSNILTVQAMPHHLMTGCLKPEQLKIKATTIAYPTQNIDTENVIHDLFPFAII